MVRGLYAVTPDCLDDEALTAKVEAALRGGATMVQYRSKRVASEARGRQARVLRAICRRHGAALIVNDDVQLAAAIGADGVHLGRDDDSIAEARGVLGSHALIGASCYNRLEYARAAQDDGASYVAFGSFFASSTKPDAVRASLGLLRQAKRELVLPVVAIGGITRENGLQVIAAGADSIAVVSALFDAADVRVAAMQLSRLFDRATEP